MKSVLHNTLLALALSTSLVFAQNKKKDEGMVSLDFHDVDISDIIKSISEITGRNFLLDPQATGKVTIVSPSPVGVSDAYHIFLSALKMKGLCAVDMGTIIKIVKDKQCLEEPIPLEGENVKTEGDQLITKIIPLKFISSNDIVKVLDPLRSGRGKISAYGPTNSIIITDYAQNAHRLAGIIEKLDRQNFQAAVEVIPLKYTGAQDMAEKLMTLLEKDKGGSRRGRSSDVEAGSDVTKILPDLRTNSLIVVANRDGLGKILDLLGELDRPVEIKTDQNRVHVYRLVHADATELANILTALVSGTPPASKKKQEKNPTTTPPVPGAYPGVEPLPWEEDQGFGATPASTGGSFTRTSGSVFQDDVRIVAEPATNALVITASPADYQALTPVILELDRRRAQVFVEALIMEVSLNKALEVGLSGNGGVGNQNGTLFGASQLGTLNPLTLAASKTNPELGKKLLSPLGLVLGGSSTKSFKIGGITIPMQAATFHALQSNGGLNVLSAPNILTTDNKRAEIVVGDKVPFKKDIATTSGIASTGFTREDVGLKLFVTPKINEGSQVTLDVEQHIQEVKSFGVEGSQELGNTERSIKSTVIIDSEQTVVLGGLIQDKEKKNVNKVPLLGDIPLIGYLFRENSISREKNNLLVFLTPHVIHDQNDLTRISVKKNNERRKFNKTQGISEFQALYDYDLDKGLNMAPPSENQKGREDLKSKHRFNYDSEPQEPEGEDQGESVGDEEASLSHRTSRRSSPRSEYARHSSSSSEEFVEITPSRRGVGRGKGASRNPFSNVRPPSSNN